MERTKHEFLKATLQPDGVQCYGYACLTFICTVTLAWLLKIAIISCVGNYTGFAIREVLKKGIDLGGF